MELRIKKDFTNLIFTIYGSINVQNGKVLEKIVLSNFRENKNLIFDFYFVNYIDSAGIGILLNIYKKLIKYNIYIKLINCCSKLKNKFKKLKIDRYITIV